MNKPLKVLQLFDFYLPSTLSWVAQLLEHLEGAEMEIGAPWIVHNQFHRPEFRYHLFPPQHWLFPRLTSEFMFPQWQRLFLGSQRHLPSYRWWLSQILRSQPPDMLHAHFGPMGCLYLPLARQLQRPLIVTFYGFDYTKLPKLRPVFHQKYQALFTEAAQVIAASAVGCERLEAMGCPPAKLAIIPPSPRLQHFPFQQREKKPGQLRLLQVATVTAKKGYLTTLEAFRLALGACPGLHLTMAGEKTDTQLVQQMQVYLRDNHLENYVTWLDFVEHHRLAEFFGEFHIFIHPSCHAPDGDHEDTPVVILEAQATGLPVIATTHFNLPAAVLHGQTGLLAPERDPEALARHIERFYRMENEEYQGFSRAARQHVETHFDVKNSAAALSNLYQKVAGNTNPAG